MTSALRESEEHDQGYGSSKIKVTILASEWGTSKGGLSTINRELAIQLAKFPDVEITFFLPKCSEEDKKEALGHKINIVEAKRRPGFEELEWLSFPPEHLQIDVIVGHGVKLGRQAQVIRDSHKCKWVQVVHTDPEEPGMFKSYSNPVSESNEKHQIEVELCEMSDFVVGVGPKLTEAFRSYLRGSQKDQAVIDFTPGVFDEFLSVRLVPDERKHCRILVFDRGDAQDFALKGLDIAAKAVASLPNSHLVFVGAPDGKHEEIKERLLQCGISASRLRVRGYISSREILKHLFYEADVVLMPSRTEGFGLKGLQALSAGLPVLISKNSGFAEALSKLPFGKMFVIDSEDPDVWAKAIKDRIRDQDWETRLEEAKVLRSYHERRYSWARQCNSLLDKMMRMVYDSSSSCQSSKHSVGKFFSSHAQISQRTDVTPEHNTGSSSSCQSSTHSAGELVSPPDQISLRPDVTTEHHAVAPRLPVRIDCEIVPLKSDAMATTQNVLNLIATRYLQTVQPSSQGEHSEFRSYLQDMRRALIVNVRSGSLVITLECSSLEILEGLWEDYCSGHLNEMAQKYLVTDEILQESGLLEVRIVTTVLEKDYRVCKEFFTVSPDESNQADSTTTEDINVNVEVNRVWSTMKDEVTEVPVSPESNQTESTITEAVDLKVEMGRIWSPIKAHEYLESPRKRRRRNSDSDLYCKAKDEEIWKTKAKQKRFLGEDKYVFVQRYLENIDDACSYTTLTSDSGIRTHGAPSELGMGDIADDTQTLFFKDLSRDATKEMGKRLRGDKDAMRQVLQSFGITEALDPDYDIFDLFPHTPVKLLKAVCEALRLCDLLDLLEKPKLDVIRSLRPAFALDEIRKWKTADRPITNHSCAAVLIFTESKNDSVAKSWQTFFKGLNDKSEVTIIKCKTISWGLFGKQIKRRKTMECRENELQESVAEENREEETDTSLDAAASTVIDRWIQRQDDFSFFAVFNLLDLSPFSDVIRKLVSRIPNKTKLVVDAWPLRKLSETLQVSFPSSCDISLLPEIVNKRWQTLDLVSMVHECKRSVYTRWEPKLSQFSPPRLTVTDTLSSLPRFKREDDLSCLRKST